VTPRLLIGFARARRATDIAFGFDDRPSEVVVLRNFDITPAGNGLDLERAGDLDRSAFFAESRFPRETTGEAAARLISNPF
jgi:hypothetical protein